MNALLIVLAIAAAPHGHKKAIHVEAESGKLSGVTVATTRAGFSGKGYVTGFSKPTDKVALRFKATAGIFEATIHYSAPNGDKAYLMRLNGVSSTSSFPDSGDKFATADAGKVELKLGTNTLEIGGGEGGFEIDSVDLVPVTINHAMKKQSAQLADLNASDKTHALFRRLLDEYGVKTFSGQYNDTDSDYITATTLRTPAIFAADFMDYSPSRVAFSPAPKSLTEDAIRRAKRGQIVTMSWHWNAPSGLINKTLQDVNGKDVDASWYKGFYTYATDFDLGKAMDDPTSAEYKLIVSDIDAIAVQLKKFADAGVPVLWRPLHEAEGGWFWWGAKGPQPFVKLWALMYKQLTEVHHLHNLIWVYTIGSNPDWYPGDQYVDVLGVDAYPADHGDTLDSTWETLKKQYDGKKLIALTEFGGVPDIPRMRKFGVEWSYFVSWIGGIKPPDTPRATLTRVYHDLSVKNKGQ